MRKGFTILELLVASLLLGMLMTILTMMFSQSSVAWRTGVAGVSDMDDIRDNMAEMREEADNAFVWGDELYRATTLWDENGELLDRACDAPGSRADGDRYHANFLRTKKSGWSAANRSKLWLTSRNLLTVGSSRNRSMDTYTVNVMSAGPDRKFNTWDDVWSWPDAFE